MNKLLLTLKSYFSTKLPVGLTSFNAWADDIILLSGEFADKDSMRFAIASILIHADAKHGSLPMQFFVKRLRKSAANQVASQVFQEIKTLQAEAQKKAQEEALSLQNTQTTEDTAEMKAVINVAKVQ